MAKPLFDPSQVKETISNDQNPKELNHFEFEILDLFRI